MLVPDAVRKASRRFVEAARAVHDGEVLGAYLHGSAARGCFATATSDMDLLVVSQAPCGDGAAREIARAQAAAREPIDAVFVTRQQLCVDVLAVPLDFLIKPGGATAGKVLRCPEGSPGFLIDRQDAHDCGIAISGPLAGDLIPPVPWPALAQSLRWLFPHISRNFKNPVLMLCRVVHGLETRALGSKREAGEWALESLEPAWQPLIARALEEYAGGAGGPAPRPDVGPFEEYCRQRVIVAR
jgi:streptomycin 3"-adenylyltransferase